MSNVDVSVQQLGSLWVASQEAKLATIYSKRKKITELDARMEEGSMGNDVFTFMCVYCRTCICI